MSASRQDPAAAAATIAAALDELEALAGAVARGALPNRGEAMRFSRARDDLLASRASALLPGFLYQCRTIHRLRDFITLYDPDASLRERFIGRAFAASRAAIAEEASPRPARTGTSGWSL